MLYDLDKVTTNLNRKGVPEELHPEVVRAVQGEIDLTDEAYHYLYMYYCGHGMPYGTAKARDGDPYEWIANELESEWSSFQVDFSEFEFELIGPEQPSTTQALTDEELDNLMKQIGVENDTTG